MSAFLGVWGRCTSGGTCGSDHRRTSRSTPPLRPGQSSHSAGQSGPLWPVPSSGAPDGKWRARYRDGNHREHARHFPRKRDAEQWLASQDVAIARGEWVDPTLSKITVGEWLPRWLALQVQLKPTTMVRYEGILRRQILPRWEVVPLARITHSDVSSWVYQLSAEGLAPASVRYAHRVLSLALAAAVRDGRLIRKSPRTYPPPRRRQTEAVPHP